MRIYYLFIFLLPSIGFCQFKYDTILLDLDHTVNLVFEEKILHFDIGSGVQEVNGKESSSIIVQMTGNRLKLGAGIENFTRTNIFVETEAGYFNFVVRYEKPKRFAHYLQNSSAEMLKKNKLHTAGNSHSSNTPAEQKSTAVETSNKKDATIEFIKRDKIRVREIGNKTQKMEYLLAGVYLHEDTIYLKIVVNNLSPVAFDLGFDSFFIIDKKKALKGALTQEEKLPYSHVVGEERVSAHDSVIRIYVFPKFTIGEKKVVRVELWEDTAGGRKTDFIIFDNILLNPKVI